MEGNPVVLQQAPSEDNGWVVQVTPETGPDGWLYGTTFGCGSNKNPKKKLKDRLSVD